jgi:hypothetical protein
MMARHAKKDLVATVWLIQYFCRIDVIREPDPGPPGEGNDKARREWLGTFGWAVHDKALSHKNMAKDTAALEDMLATFRDAFEEPMGALEAEELEQSNE